MNAFASAGALQIDGVVSRICSFSFAELFVLAESTIDQLSKCRIRWETDNGDAYGIDEIAPGLFDEIFYAGLLFGQCTWLSPEDFDDMTRRMIKLIAAASPTLLEWILGTNLNEEIGKFLERGSSDDDV